MSGYTHATQNMIGYYLLSKSNSTHTGREQSSVPGPVGVPIGSITVSIDSAGAGMYCVVLYMNISAVFGFSEVLGSLVADHCFDMSGACCGVLQCVAVCCSVLQCVAVCCLLRTIALICQEHGACCSVLQCVAVCCSMLQCVAVHCSVLLVADHCFDMSGAFIRGIMIHLWHVPLCISGCVLYLIYSWHPFEGYICRRVTCTSYVIHINESWQTYDWGMLHVLMSQVTQEGCKNANKWVRVCKHTNKWVCEHTSKWVWGGYD